MRTHALRLLAALFAFALVAAACGDDDTTEAASPSDLGDADTARNDHDHANHGDDDHGDDDHGDDDHMSGADGHDHGTPVEFEGTDVPTVDVRVEADPAGGINIMVATTNYTVAPEAASTDHVEGEGHFHLSIDGAKVQRFYNDAIHYVGVTEGEVTVMVELSANDHRTYAVDGEPIMAMTAFDVPAHDHGEHNHGDADQVTWEGAAPELTVEVVEDPKSGYNALITVDGMTLSADNVNGANVAGEGHLHIYVNGQKLGRLYGPATHIPILPQGEVEITVGAFANDHRTYVLDGEPIEASTTITVES
ncbi:MAG: hypothetical protein AAF081_06315 [Actinomycetota bacterium]